jgi:hypothetical protein
MTTGDDDDLAGRLRKKMTELRARQALQPESQPEQVARSLTDLGVRLESHAQLLETNTRLLAALLPLLEACPRCEPGREG